MTEQKKQYSNVSFFDAKTDLETIAAEQGVSVASTFEQLLGDFWPEDETVDQFMASVRAWRREEEGSKES